MLIESYAGKKKSLNRFQIIEILQTMLSDNRMKRVIDDNKTSRKSLNICCLIRLPLNNACNKEEITKETRNYFEIIDNKSTLHLIRPVQLKPFFEGNL